MQKKRSFIQQTGSLGKVLSIGFTGGVCMAISLFMGYQFDLYFSTEPYGIISGIITGIAAAAIQTWKQLQESMSSFAEKSEHSKHKNTKM